MLSRSARTAGGRTRIRFSTSAAPCGIGALRLAVSRAHIPRKTSTAAHTSAIVHFFHLDICQSDAGQDGVDVVDPASRCKAKPLPIEERDQVLPVGPFFGLPADMESATQLDAAERSDSASQGCIKLLSSVSRCRKAVFRPTLTRSGNTNRS